MSSFTRSRAQGLEGDTRVLGESTAVVCCGPWLSAATGAAFADGVVAARENGVRELVLDLTAVRAVDTAGTATLGALAEELDVVGCELAVAATHPGLVAWLTSAPPGVDLPVYDGVDEALADLLRRPV